MRERYLRTGRLGQAKQILGSAWGGYAIQSDKLSDYGVDAVVSRRLLEKHCRGCWNWRGLGIGRTHLAVVAEHGLCIYNPTRIGCQRHSASKSPSCSTRPMGRLIKMQDLDQFREVVQVSEESITPDLRESMQQLDERRNLEPMLREVLYDPTETPHGPTEIADILTTKVRVRGEQRLAAFVVKGRSFAKVRSRDIAHQVIRLRTLPDLGVMVLVTVGHIQDDARRDFIQMAKDADCDYLIIDSNDLTRLLLAYEKICPSDGTPFGPDGSCHLGHKQDEGTSLKVRGHRGRPYDIPRMEDVSHGGARRLSATVFVSPHCDREVLREIIHEATREVRESSYYRNELLRRRWCNSHAHVVWLFLAADHRDVQDLNWLARTQWIDPLLDPTMRPYEMSASEYLDSIAISWNDSYARMRDFYRERSVDKGGALADLEPLTRRAARVGCRITGWFGEFESGNIEEAALIAKIRAVSPEIDAISDIASNLRSPPQDVSDYQNRAQCLFCHLSNMALYYSESGIETWTEKNRTVLMRDSVKGFRADIRRLEFEREKLH